jgi:putative SOS response-associated peptidase YedK
MRPIHDRQPEILEPREYTEYLMTAPQPPLHLLHILPGEEMKASTANEGLQGLLFGDSQ